MNSHYAYYTKIKTRAAFDLGLKVFSWAEFYAKMDMDQYPYIDIILEHMVKFRLRDWDTISFRQRLTAARVRWANESDQPVNQPPRRLASVVGGFANTTSALNTPLRSNLDPAIVLNSQLAYSNFGNAFWIREAFRGKGSISRGGGMPSSWSEANGGIYYAQHNGVLGQGQFYMVSRSTVECALREYGWICLTCPGEDWLFGANIYESWHPSFTKLRLAKTEEDRARLKKKCPEPWYVDPFKARHNIGCMCRTRVRDQCLCRRKKIASCNTDDENLFGYMKKSRHN